MSTATPVVRRLRIGPRSADATPLLPGFELPLARLLSLADRWAKKKRRGAKPRGLCSVSNMATEIPKSPLVGVVMGSKSDWETMRHASDLLTELGIPHESKVVSAHRTPDRLFRYGQEAEGRGLEVLIAGAGGACALTGNAGVDCDHPARAGRAGRERGAARRRLAVVDRANAARRTRRHAGNRRLGAANAAILAAAILGRKYPAIRESLARYRQAQTDAVGESPS